MNKTLLSPDVPFTPSPRRGDVAPAVPVDVFEALYEIGRAVQEEVVDPAAVLSLLVRKTSQLLQADVAWIALLDEATETVRVVASYGVRETDFNEMAVTMGAGLGGVALRQNRTLVVDDYAEYTADTPTLVHDTMLAEGVVSVMCAPMLRADKMIGALYAANRRHTQFRGEHASLLSTVATQASSAVQHARLFAELEHRNQLLEQTFAVQRTLIGVGLNEAGVPGIAEALVRILERDITIEQDVVPPFSARYRHRNDVGADADVESAACLAVSVAAGDVKLGSICVAGDALSEMQTLALEQGATVVALELLKQRAARDVEWRLRGELLEELLEAAGALTDGLLARAERLAVDLTEPRRVLVIEAVDGHVNYGELLGVARMKASRRVMGTGGGVLAVKRGGRVVLALNGDAETSSMLILGDIRSTLEGRGVQIIAGVSEPSTDLGGAYKEAVSCLHLAQRGAVTRPVVRASELGPLRFLLSSGDVKDAVAMVRTELGSIREADSFGRPPLMETLRAYLEADGHQPTVAAACFIHVSTLKYRLRRVHELLAPRDLSSPEVRFQLKLAFRILDILEALGVEAFVPRVGSRTTTPDTNEVVRDPQSRKKKK